VPPGEHRRQALPVRQLSNATAHLVENDTGLDDHGVGTISADLCEDAVEVALAADQHVSKLQAEAR
jgi:hypothetical protein